MIPYGNNIDREAHYYCKTIRIPDKKHAKSESAYAERISGGLWDGGSIYSGAGKREVNLFIGKDVGGREHVGDQA